MSKPRISVVGLGYIGLPTAALFAAHDFDVVGVDVNPVAVETINRGEVHIVEPDLDAMVRDTVARGRLRATLTPEAADVFLLAVPTPFVDDGQHTPDLRYIAAAARAIAPVLAAGNLVILESTSPVGATEQMSAWLAEARPDLSFPQTAGAASDIRIAHCPERVLPGHVLRELIENDRVIGGLSAACTEQAVAFYKSIVDGDCLPTDARTAEMVKLTENSFRDVNIAFANELSVIADKLDINVWELIRLANRHPRVNILQPGPGVGGHCIAVDPWFIVSRTPDAARLIAQARHVNDDKPGWVLDKVSQAVAATGKPADEVTVACLGLAFKPDIDDLRESPALDITRALATRHSGPLQVVEPNITALPAGLEGAQLVSPEAALAAADVVVLLVDHREFRELEAPQGVQLVDTRGLWTGR